VAQAVGDALVQDQHEQSSGGEQDQQLVGPAPRDPSVASRSNRQPDREGQRRRGSQGRAQGVVGVVPGDALLRGRQHEHREAPRQPTAPIDAVP